jgi:hypothetical protein
MLGQCHQGSPVNITHGLECRLQCVCTAIRLFAIIFDSLFRQRGALLFNRDVRGHLRFADLASFLFDSDFGVQFTLLDSPFLLDSVVSPSINGFIRAALQRLAGFGL